MLEMTAEWWMSWEERWAMAEEELLAWWAVEEVTRVERWGREVDGEELLWKAALQSEVRELWARAWREAEAEDRRRRKELAEQER